MYNFASAVFFPKFEAFWLYIYDSKYCPSLATTFSYLSSSVRIPRRKNWSSFEAPRIDPIFYFFIRPEGAGQPGRVPLIETSDSQREQCLKNTAGGIGLPISTFPSMS